jgi:hypothetical protein
MDIKSRFFPHPVLNKFSDDYITSSFSNEITLVREINDLIFNFKSTLDDSGLLKLIEEEKAEFVFHIECSQMFYREIVTTKMIETIFGINEKRIQGKVNVCSFIIAKENINTYYNDNFHEDYDDTKFSITKGNILAMGNQVNFTITKDTEDLFKIPSIFSIIREDTDENIGAKIDADRDKIKITLNNEDFSNYGILASRPDLQPSLHGMLIYPALIQVFERIKHSDIEEFEDRRWFRAINGKLKQGGLELNKEIIELRGSDTLAQRLLGLPINRALTALVNIGEEDEEE